MPYATTRFLSLALALAVALCPTALFACDACGMPVTVSCLHQNILDSFREGGGEEPAAFRTTGSGWSTTSGGSRSSGEPALLTWSIVPNGTPMPSGQGEPNAPSDLITFLDNIHHGGPGPGGADFTQRDWFSLISTSFDRWDAVSGLRFSYEPNDDGVFLGSSSNVGILGRRGDHRLGGHNIDGPTRPSVVAYNYFPNNSDMVIDTSESLLMGNDFGNYLRFRNTVMHEAGHGLGLNHLDSSGAGNNFLMEPFLATSFDGPQFDDILGIHFLYGDRYEENGGNDIVARATNLGSLGVHQTLKLGEDAVDRAVAPTDVDFVSINKNSDPDYFKISIPKAGKLDLLLTPVGPTYQEGPQGGTQTPFNTSALGDLSLFLYDHTGVNLLGSSLVGGLGASESIPFLSLANAGDYLIRVSGSLIEDPSGRRVTQFYQLDIALVPEPTGVALLALGMVTAGGRRRSGAR